MEIYHKYKNRVVYYQLVDIISKTLLVAHHIFL